MKNQPQPKNLKTLSKIMFLLLVLTLFNACASAGKPEPVFKPHPFLQLEQDDKGDVLKPGNRGVFIDSAKNIITVDDDNFAQTYFLMPLSDLSAIHTKFMECKKW